MELIYGSHRGACAPSLRACCRTGCRTSMNDVGFMDVGHPPCTEQPATRTAMIITTGAGAYHAWAAGIGHSADKEQSVSSRYATAGDAHMRQSATHHRLLRNNRVYCTSTRTTPLRCRALRCGAKPSEVMMTASKLCLYTITFLCNHITHVPCFVSLRRPP